MVSFSKRRRRFTFPVFRVTRRDKGPNYRRSYDVPMQFISQKVEIRYLPEDMDSAFILSEGEHFPIRATDKNENCRTKRESNLPADYTKIGGGN